MTTQRLIYVKSGVVHTSKRGAYIFKGRGGHHIRRGEWLVREGIWNIRSSIYLIKRVACIIMEEYMAHKE